MLALYREAVGIMKELPRHDPRNWYFQSNIHAYPEGARLPNLPREELVATIFDQGKGGTQAERDQIRRHRVLALGTAGQGGIWHSCSHFHHHFVAGEDGRELHFLTWHRMYLYFLEQIIEGLLGRAFSVPYWNYQLASQQRIPPELASEGTVASANHLYFRERNKHFLDHGLAPALTDTRAAFRESRLVTGGVNNGFSGQINHGPHGAVHGAVGSSRGMGSFEYAARDPIFWLHHANIDRLWESWRNPTLNGASSRDPTMRSWLEQEFAFASPRGERVRMRVGDVVNLSSRLRYRYDMLEEVPTVLAAGPEIELGTPRATLSQTPPERQPQITEMDVPVAVSVMPAAPPSVVMGFRGRADARYYLIIEVETTSAPGGVYEVHARVPRAPGSKETVERRLDTFHLFGPLGGGSRTITWMTEVTELVQQNLIDPARSVELVFRAQYARPAVPVTIRKVTIRAL